MLITPQHEVQKEMVKHNREELDALIEEQVIQILGKPAGLRKVQVRQLWENNYRINILVGADASSLTIANSYFLKIDGAGNLVESTPKITKLY